MLSLRTSKLISQCFERSFCVHLIQSALNTSLSSPPLHQSAMLPTCFESNVTFSLLGYSSQKSSFSTHSKIHSKSPTMDWIQSSLSAISPTLGVIVSFPAANHSLRVGLRSFSVENLGRNSNTFSNEADSLVKTVEVINSEESVSQATELSVDKVEGITTVVRNSMKPKKNKKEKLLKEEQQIDKLSSEMGQIIEDVPEVGIQSNGRPPSDKFQYVRSDQQFEGFRKDKLVLRGLVFHGYHGVFKEERVLGQKFTVDLDTTVDLRKAAETDDFKDAVSYADIYMCVKNVVEGPPFRLLEALAGNIVKKLFDQFPQVQSIRVRIGKPQVAVPGVVDYLGVDVTRFRVKNRTKTPVAQQVKRIENPRDINLQAQDEWDELGS